MKEFSRGVVGGGRKRTSKAEAALARMVEQTKDDAGFSIEVAGRKIFEARDGEIVLGGEDGSAGEPAPKEAGSKSRGAAAARLRSFVERIERLEQEIAAQREDLKAVYAEAKGEGWDAPTIRAVVRERKKDQHKRSEQLSLFELYWSHVGDA